jgi:steroid 5-alpha reductase family enzyme
VKLNTYISIHKAATGLFVLGLMAYFQQWENYTAWVYLGLHGSYGLLWFLKSRYFPDQNWEKKVSPVSGILVGWGSLSTYWVAPLLLNWHGVIAPFWVISASIFLYAVGVFFHVSADSHKFAVLRRSPENLITDGVWALCRNPNYFGELLIYSSFVLLVLHWLPAAILLLWVLVFWIPNMLRKEASLARYPEFPAYRERTKMFIPFLY